MISHLLSGRVSTFALGYDNAGQLSAATLTGSSGTIDRHGSAGIGIVGVSGSADYDGSYGRHGGVSGSVGVYSLWTQYAYAGRANFGSQPECGRSGPAFGNPSGSVKGTKATFGAAWNVGIGATYVW